MHIERTTTLIVGAGPTGLVLARRLKQLNVPFIIIDKRTQTSQETRSIGIHPTGAAILQCLGLGSELHKHARRVKTGQAYGSTHRLGTLSFSEGILTLSQVITMQLLDLTETRRGVEFIGTEPAEHGIRAFVRTADGVEYIIHAEWLIGCDGHRSRVRDKAGITTQTFDYPDHIIMGDFPESPALGDKAHIYVHRDGLAEALPMSGDQRRWLARLLEPIDTEPTPEDLVKIIKERTGHELNQPPNSPIRVFRPQRMLADHVVQGRILLAGDAAHVMSPIGGQGMNVGWMDAWELAELVVGGEKHDIENYNRRCRKRAHKAIRVAERNMAIGRPSRHSWFRSTIIWLSLHSPLTRYMDQLFTLQRVPFNSATLTRPPETPRQRATAPPP